MKVLGIESSCDETAAAVVQEDGTVLSDVVATQITEHAPYGGVVPELASRAHLRNIVPVIRQALSPISGGLDSIDAVAVTRGPGLVGSLLVGVETAKAIAWARNIPWVGVNHLEGHLLAVYLRQEGSPECPPMPFIALLVSGGHTSIYEVRSPLDVELLSSTRDDAAGEAYDKVAKLLGLGYPGGPVIDRLAEGGDPYSVDLPMPMKRRNSLEFSFSGLKTAVAQRVRSGGVPETPEGMANLCASFQQVVVETLVTKSFAACEQRSCQHLVLAGGVAANRGLRRRMKVEAEQSGVSLYVPPARSCTDNAAMIAFAGAVRLRAGERADLTMNAFSRDPGFRRGRFPQTAVIP